MVDSTVKIESKEIDQLGAYIHYNSSQNWQTILGAKGEIISVKWPTKVPYSLYLAEKDEWEHVGNPKH